MNRRSLICAAVATALARFYPMGVEPDVATYSFSAPTRIIYYKPRYLFVRLPSNPRLPA